MRSLIRYGLVAAATVALLTIGFVTFRARLEQKVQAQTPAQVAGCDATSVPSRTNPCLVISSFRENGPGGTGDEFVEIYNASRLPVTVSTLSDDPSIGGSANGIGVFASAGMGFNPSFGQAANVASLACQIPGGNIIRGRSWFLCVGTAYTLATRGVNGGSAHSTGDQLIGAGNASTGTTDIPDDAGLALLNIGTNIATVCEIGTFNCPTGFNYPGGGTGNAVVLDKVGFNPYGPGSPTNTGPGLYPGNIYPRLAAQYCDGTLTPAPPPGVPPFVAFNSGCLSPVGDASTITLGPATPCPGSVTVPNPIYTIAGPGAQYDTLFPVVDGGFILQANGVTSATHKCYGESGQYKIERRRSGQTFTASAGDIHRDSFNSITLACLASPAPSTCGNADDFILDAPNPSTGNVGLTLSGASGLTSILGAAAPHNCQGGGPGVICTNPPGIAGAPPIIGNTQFTQDAFDTCAGALIPCTVGQLQARNAERRYPMDPNIHGTANDPFGTFILRFRYINNTGVPVTGVRWRIDDISTLCGGQTGTFGIGSTVATQEGRNLRIPNQSIPPVLTPTPTCQGEGSDVGAFTALLKGVNHYGEVVVDSSLVARLVWGTVLEDVYTGAPPTATPATGALQPFGGGSNSSWVANTTAVGNDVINVAPLGPAAIPNIGDGVSGGIGTFAKAIASGATFRVAFKFGVVKSGRFKILVGREVASSATPLP